MASPENSLEHDLGITSEEFTATAEYLPGTTEDQIPPALGMRGADSEKVVHIQLTYSQDSKEPSNQFPWPNSVHAFSSSVHSENDTTRNSHLKPLSFPEKGGEMSSCFTSEELDLPIQCLLCSTTFNSEKLRSECDGLQEHGVAGPSEESSHQTGGAVAVKPALKPPRVKLTPKDEWLRHLLLEHKIVIHNVEEISSLKCYSEYWKKRLQEASITEFAPVIRTNTNSNFPSEDYYLFSSALPEEKSLRHYLHKKKLEAVLEVQQREREDSLFSRRCLFCSQILTGNRRVLFQHMLDNHGFNIGQPDNLVFVREFLDLLQEKLDSLQCLFCERTFRDRATLKDHMRKKGHKKINSQNKTYDRFYIINYLELGKTWEQVQEEEDREKGFATESDWTEDPAPLNDSVYCLFCLTPHTSTDTTHTHMREAHGFDFLTLCTEQDLNYYSQVKLVNYIRRKVYANSCVYCSQQFSSSTHLLDHMTVSSHFRLPSNRGSWDQSQYLFPTYENDSLLYGLDDESS